VQLSSNVRSSRRRSARRPTCSSLQPMSSVLHAHPSRMRHGLGLGSCWDRPLCTGRLSRFHGPGAPAAGRSAAPAPSTPFKQGWLPSSEPGNGWAGRQPRAPGAAGTDAPPEGDQCAGRRVLDTSRCPRSPCASDRTRHGLGILRSVGPTPLHGEGVQFHRPLGARQAAGRSACPPPPFQARLVPRSEPGDAAPRCSLLACDNQGTVWKSALPKAYTAF